MSRTIQVFEHEKLTLNPDRLGRSLSPSELGKLYAFNDKGNNLYFTGIRDGVKFKNYVGVIQIGGLTLEILPKADKLTESSIVEIDKSMLNWHNALLRMLAICKHIRVDSVSEASLERRHHSILDLYFLLFIDEVDKLLRQGLIKKYHKQEGNLSVLKGRLDFGKNIQRNLIHKERFYTHHEVYDQNHLINQILLRALKILDKVATNPTVIDRLARIKLDFPEVNSIEIQAHHFEKLSENRKIFNYHEAIKIARMIILNYSPDISKGQEDMLALLFDMNKLWEEYVYRVLLSHNTHGLKISFQNSQRFWENKLIRPDLIISLDRKTFIIDTKWKVIDSKKPDDGDLKQMFAYNLHWESFHSILLYPTSEVDLKPVRGNYYKGLGGTHGCSLAFVNVLDQNGKLNREFSKQILALLT